MTADEEGLGETSTATARIFDTSVVDMGFHRPALIDSIRRVIYLVKAAGATVIHRASPAGPTFDLIRGDLASLWDTGTSIDMGLVDCVADGDTTGLVEDTVLPSEPPVAGCYVYYEGDGSATERYGHSSNGRTRVPAGGDCP